VVLGVVVPTVLPTGRAYDTCRVLLPGIIPAYHTMVGPTVGPRSYQPATVPGTWYSSTGPPTGRSYKILVPFGWTDSRALPGPTGTGTGTTYLGPSTGTGTVLVSGLVYQRGTTVPGFGTWYYQDSLPGIIRMIVHTNQIDNRSYYYDRFLPSIDRTGTHVPISGSKS